MWGGGGGESYSQYRELLLNVILCQLRSNAYVDTRTSNNFKDVSKSEHKDYDIWYSCQMLQIDVLKFLCLVKRSFKDIMHEYRFFFFWGGGVNLHGYYTYVTF